MARAANTLFGAQWEHIMRGIGFGTVIAAVAAYLLPGQAAACGGFFCNAAEPVPIIQAGEQIVFARTGDLTHMHIQVSYDGDPTSFGWLLPLSERPRGDDGEPAPLEELLRLSHPKLFDRLSQGTAPRFELTTTQVETNCPSPFPASSSVGCGSIESAGGGSRGTSSLGGSNAPRSPDV